MTKKPFIIGLAMILMALFFSTTQGSAADESTYPLKSRVLCLPGIYLSEPDDCVPSGPADYLTRMAGSGMVLPLQPLPASKPDSALIYSYNQYARLNPGVAAPVYASLEDATAKAHPVRYIAAGDLRFISYIQEAYVDNRPKPDYFQLKSGEWVSAAEVAERWRSVSAFQGLEFQQTPLNSFGWVNAINASVETKQTPGTQVDDYTGRQVAQYEVLQVYATHSIGESEWYQIAPDEWVDGRYIGMVKPVAEPPEGVSNGRWIEVNLQEQTVAVYDQNELVFATLIASGLEPFYTRPGLFSVYKKLSSTPMQGAFEADRSDFYYLEDVPWTMYFDEARALHGAYWRTRLGFPQSHGCVNLAPGDAHWLFDWASEGDWVYVWDPSGKTPTDPAYYGEGGA